MVDQIREYGKLFFKKCCIKHATSALHPISSSLDRSPDLSRPWASAFPLVKCILTIACFLSVNLHCPGLFPNSSSKPKFCEWCMWAIRTRKDLLAYQIRLCHSADEEQEAQRLCGLPQVTQPGSQNENPPTWLPAALPLFFQRHHICPLLNILQFGKFILIRVIFSNRRRTTDSFRRPFPWEITWCQP